MWQVYILKCSDGTYYAGITTDLERRVEEHNHSILGAKYTMARRPVKLVYARAMQSRSLAAQAEYRIKKMRRRKKIELIKGKKTIK